MDWYDVDKTKSLVLDLMVENRELRASLKTWQDTATYWHGEYRKMINGRCEAYCEEIGQEV